MPTHSHLVAKGRAEGSAIGQVLGIVVMLKPIASSPNIFHFVEPFLGEAHNPFTRFAGHSPEAAAPCSLKKVPQCLLQLLGAMHKQCVVLRPTLSIFATSDVA